MPQQWWQGQGQQQAPTSGYGTYSSAPAQQPMQPAQQAPPQPAQPQQPAQQAPGQQQPMQQPMQPQQQQFNSNLGGLASQAYNIQVGHNPEMARGFIGDEASRIAQNFQGNQAGLDAYMQALRGQFGERFNQNSGYNSRFAGGEDMLFSLLSQGVQGHTPQAAPTWQDQSWQQWGSNG